MNKSKLLQVLRRLTKKGMDVLSCMFQMLRVPLIWIRAYESDKIVDYIINHIIEHDAEIEFFDDCYVRFKGYPIKVWICNYPYASYTITIIRKRKGVNEEIKINKLPKRCTTFKFKKFLDRKLLKYTTQHLLNSNTATKGSSDNIPNQRDISR